MSLTHKNKNDAEYFTVVKPVIPFFAHREHLPNVDPEVIDKYSQEEWNEIIEFLVNAANNQRFSDPYYWQHHEKTSFVQWLSSWKV